MRSNSEFSRIWLGNASSNLADGVTFIALPLLAVTLTQDPLAIAGVSVAFTVPRIIAVLGTGVLVDRGDRRRLLYVSNYSRAAIFALLMLLIALDLLSLPVLYLTVAIVGVMETLSDSSAFAVLPQAVPAQGIDTANSRIAGTQIVVDEFVGPPLGGFLFGIAALAPVAMNALAFLLAGASYHSLKGDYRSQEDAEVPRPSFYADVREGAMWIRRNPIVRTLVAVGAIASVAYMIPFSYLVLYARDVLGLDATGYGLLLSFSALGGLLGAWVASKLRSRLGYYWSIVGALVTGAASFIVIFFVDDLVVVAVALAVYIGHSVVWNVLASSMRQKATPHRIMGRVGAVTRLLSLSGLALGALVGGWLASSFELRFPFLVSGLLFVVAALICVVVAPTFRAWERGQPSKEEAVGTV